MIYNSAGGRWKKMTLPDFSVPQWGGGTVAKPNKHLFAPRVDAIDAWQLYHAIFTAVVATHTLRF